MKKEIRNISLASIFSALSVALIIAGTSFELLDLSVAALCSITVYISMIEIRGKYPLLIYATVSVLSLIFMPMSTASLYYITFFGYYPIIRHKIKQKYKAISVLICLLIFDITMVLTLLLFKTVFSLQNEPAFMYIILLITANIFFLCFDYALNIFAFIYIKKIRTRLGLK